MKRWYVRRILWAMFGPSDSFLQWYARRILLAILVPLIMMVWWMPGWAVGGYVASLLGLSADAAMWIMLGACFMPVLVVAWWPK
jgi:hypothetical protein